MNQLFKKLPLQTKLLFIGLFPSIFLFFLTMQLDEERTERLELFDNYKKYITKSENINKLIDAMQEERKFSYDYAITKSQHQELVLQRPRTDSFLQALLKSNDPSLEGFTEYTNLEKLSDIRKRIDSQEIRSDEIMHFYSNTVFRINTLNTIPPANTPYLQSVYSDLMMQKSLSEMITYLGIIRSNIYNVLHTNKYVTETLIGTYGTYEVYVSYEKELLAKASPEMTALYKKVNETTPLLPTKTYIHNVFKKFAFDDSYTAQKWWKVSDEGVNALRELQLSIWDEINLKIDRLYLEEQQARNKSLFVLVFALLAMILLVGYIVYIIRNTLKELCLAAMNISKGATNVPIEIESHDVIGMLSKSIIEIDKNNQILIKSATAIGKGDFSIPLTPRSDSDVLSNAIITMKNELMQYSQKMEELVDERTQELARSNDDLKQFAHVASHDLKEPLRKISMFSKMLSEDQNASLSEKGKLYLHKIDHAANRMTNMIEGILTYSTVSANELPFESVDLNAIMDDVKIDLEVPIIQKEARIVYDTLPKVNGLKLLLHQLFYNLVNNALKFSRADIPPVVTITWEIESRPARHTTKSNQSYLHIKVGDNGIGFDPMYAEKMFGVFYRLNSKDSFEGSGIGLALCRRIVDRHKGEIYAEAQEGNGATFHIFLPA